MVERYLEQQTAVFSALKGPQEQGDIQSDWCGGEHCWECDCGYEASEDNHHNVEHWNNTVSFYDLTTENYDPEICGTKWLGHYHCQGNQACHQRKSAQPVHWPWASEVYCVGSEAQDTSTPGTCLSSKYLRGTPRPRSPQQSWTGMY